MPAGYFRWIIAAVFALGLVAIGYTYKKYRIAPGIDFAELEALDALGAKEKVWQKTGRGAIIVFFASWCHDCARELPKLARALQGQLAGIDVIALTDEGMATMLKYREQTRYNFRFYALPRDFEHYGIHAIPTFYLLNSLGQVMFTQVGDVDWSAPGIRQKLE